VWLGSSSNEGWKGHTTVAVPIMVSPGSENNGTIKKMNKNESPFQPEILHMGQVMGLSEFQPSTITVRYTLCTQVSLVFTACTHLCMKEDALLQAKAAIRNGCTWVVENHVSLSSLVALIQLDIHTAAIHTDTPSLHSRSREVWSDLCKCISLALCLTLTAVTCTVVRKKRPLPRI
jgi:hypothetical protein